MLKCSVRQMGKPNELEVDELLQRRYYWHVIEILVETSGHSPIVALILC